MQKLEGYWVKPFASGMSCIDTITGECGRGSTLDECMQQCEHSPFCDAGYHVSFRDLPISSYCVPLNTSIYKNTNFLNNLITPENSTRLSRDNGIDLTVFYNPKRFPSDVDLTKYIFHGDTCFLAQKSSDETFVFLQKDFFFRPDQDNALPLTLGESNNLVFDFDVRINKQNAIHFFQENSLALLTWTSDGMWSFLPYTLPGLEFRFQDVPQFFVDYGTPFFLISEGLGYLTCNDKKELVFSSTKPSEPFVFMYDAENNINTMTRRPWEQRVLADDQDFKKTMENFLCQNFPNCRVRKAVPAYAKPWQSIVLIVVAVLCFMCWSMVAIVLFVRK